MQLHCANCHTLIPADKIDIQQTLAVCPQCHTVFNFGRKIDPEKPARRKLKPPKRIITEETPDGLRITYDWFSAKILSLAFFTLIWDGFMLVWYGTAITQGEWLMALCGTLHGAVGLALAYGTLTGFVNMTRITVSYDVVQVRHGPIPAPGNKVINRNEIEQVYCKEKMQSTKNGVTRTYDLRLVLLGGRDEVLVNDLDDFTHAAYIEQQIENYLYIQDASVPGEHRP